MVGSVNTGGWNTLDQPFTDPVVLCTLLLLTDLFLNLVEEKARYISENIYINALSGSDMFGLTSVAKTLKTPNGSFRLLVWKLLKF